MDTDGEEIQIVSTSHRLSYTEIKRSLSFPVSTTYHKDSFVGTISQSLQDSSRAFAMKPFVDAVPRRSQSDPNKPFSMETNRGKTQCQGVRKMYLSAMASLLYAVSMGMAVGYSSPATFDMEHRASSRIKVDQNDITWIGSIIAVGALSGGLVAGPLADKIGRKGTLIYNSIPFITGWLLIIYAPSVPVILVGRFIKGFACGLVSVAVPMYTVEISTPEIRGLLGSSFQGMLVIGCLLVMTIGAYVTWTWLAVISTATVIAGLICLGPMPESPRWLVAKGRREEAVKAIRFLQGDHFDVYGEVNAIQADLMLQPKGKLTFRELLQPTVYKPSLLSSSLMFLQQFSGSNAVIFYTAAIFESAGNTMDPRESSIIIAFIQVVATLLSNAIVDKAGRKILLLLSGFAMAVSMGILGAFYYLAEDNESFRHTSGWIPLASLIVFIAAFSLGYGPIPWLMAAEMVPVRARSTISGLATFSNGLFAFIVTKTFKAMEESLKPYGTYWFYCGISLLGCVFVGFFLPETKGKRLEDIQKIFLKAPKSKPNSSCSVLVLTNE